MRRMRFMPQSVQEQNIQALKLMERRFRDLAVVSEIGPRSKAVAVNLGFSVNQDDRFKPHSQNIHGTINRAQFEQRQSPELVVGIENVAEHFAQKRRRVGPRVEWQLFRLVPVT